MEGREGGTEVAGPWNKAGRESAVFRSEWPRQRFSSTDLDGRGSSEHFANREHYQQRSDDEVQGRAKRGGEE